MDKAWRLTAGAGWMAAAAAAAVMLLRIVDAVSLTQPLVGPTSGAEWESAFAVWKWIAGEPVYQDPYRIPFAASYYNWLFYALYGAAVKAGLWLFSLSPLWIPTLAKIVSLVLTGVGAALLWQLLADAAASRKELRALAGPLAVGFFLGPLVGYWAISINCEMGATVMGLAALLAFLRLRPSHPLAAIVLASALSYLAWSFKQSHVFVGLTLGAFLLVRRDIKGAALCVAIHLGGVAAAWALGSAVYADMVFMSKQTMFFSTGQLTRNLINFTVKCTPLLAVVALGVLAFAGMNDRRRVFAGDGPLLSVLGLVISVILAVAASAKVGAAENYYFPMAVFLALAGVNLLSAAPPLRTSAIGMIVGFGVNLAACALVLAGVTGVTSVRAENDKMTERARCLEGYPGPVFAADPGLNAPWFQAGGPYFALANIYFDDRKLGLPFERNGIGGLIGEGYFATLALSSGTEPVYDGQALSRYRLGGASCAGLDIYVRKEKASP
jgi:hypothetical protein